MEICFQKRQDSRYPDLGIEFAVSALKFNKFSKGRSRIARGKYRNPNESCIAIHLHKIWKTIPEEKPSNIVAKLEFCKSVVEPHCLYTSHVPHNGWYRRKLLPNSADFRNFFANLQSVHFDFRDKLASTTSMNGDSHESSWIHGGLQAFHAVVRYH
ncbi:hypothetical protein CEXT_468191 [Caerostris extrusa]|uniref:Uncharacterized protein n=1 Tax=Caerostris extrusa TaxID=172846 RepID=A0AAV4YD10_CAEEX|nr:hypothetical protein CEXT_468191 [Caerostris extrusa]